MNNTTKRYSVGIDIGGTKIKAVLFDGKNVVANSVAVTPKNSLRRFFIAIDDLVNSMVEKVGKEDIEGIGVGVPAVLNTTRRIVLDAPNISILNNVPIVNKLKEMFNLPIIVDNDVNCFLLAEMKMGVGKGYKNAYGIIIGTGIGGAWWLGDDINRGVNTEIEEPGRMMINSESSLEGIYYELMKSKPTVFIDEVLKGDEQSLKNFKEIGRYIGVVLGDIVNVIDPEIIVMGGGVVKFDKFFLSSLEDSMLEKIDFSKIKNKVKIVKSHIGKYAGAIGASLLVK